MKVKDKAEELINKYYLELKEDKGYYDFETARVCALICVDEILKAIPAFSELTPIFWQQVKQEILNRQ